MILATKGLLILRISKVLVVIEVQPIRLMILFQEIESLMIKFKIKRMKQTLQGLMLKIKEKEDQYELSVAPNWATSYKLMKMI